MCHISDKTQVVEAPKGLNLPLVTGPGPPSRDTTPATPREVTPSTPREITQITTPGSTVTFPGQSFQSVPKLERNIIDGSFTVPLPTSGSR